MASTPPRFVFPATDSAAASSALSSNPSSSTSANTINQINSAESTNLYNSFNSAVDSSSSALNYGMYVYRNKTISDIATELTQKNNSINNGESETLTRQAEINEWQAQNKLDTFFFLQCSFIFLTFVILLIYLQRYGLIPNETFYMLIFIGTIVLLGILWNRAYYTYNTRDKKSWNRRYIGLPEVGITPTPESDCPAQDTKTVSPSPPPPNAAPLTLTPVTPPVGGPPPPIGGGPPPPIGGGPPPRIGGGPPPRVTQGFTGSYNDGNSVMVGGYDATGNLIEKYVDSPSTSPSEINSRLVDISDNAVSVANSVLNRHAVSGYPAEIHPLMLSSSVGVEEDEDNENMVLKETFVDSGTVASTQMAITASQNKVKNLNKQLKAAQVSLRDARIRLKQISPAPKK
jgi:hypothetical protein